MKKQSCEKLAKALIPYLNSFAYERKANALCRVPIGNLLQGMVFNSSGFSAQAFYAEVFVQPLYIPAKHFTLNFGKRLPGNWEYDGDNVESLAAKLIQSMKAARAFELWEDLSTPENLARNLANYHPDRNDPHFQRAVGYSLAAAALSTGTYQRVVLWSLQTPTDAQLLRLNAAPRSSRRGRPISTRIRHQWIGYVGSYV